MKTTLLFLCFYTFVVNSTWQTRGQSLQECGNDLIQRLEIGLQGWIDPAPPTQSVRIRQGPQEAQIDSLEPGEVFTVLGGPECFGSYSWFEIETDSGKRGWIAEGVEADEYFVDPLPTTGSIEVDRTSCADSPKGFNVGDYVELTSEPTADLLFYGHPLVDSAYVSLQAYFQLFFQNNEFESPDDYLGQLRWPEGSYLLNDGPVCVNSTYVWQIKTGVSWFWIDEQHLRMSGEQPDIIPIYQPQSVSLSEPSAPLISPQLQVAFDSSGGGGGGPPVLDIFSDECLTYGYTVSYEHRCFTIYPFPEGESLAVVIKQADGITISEANLVSTPIDLEIKSIPGQSRTIQTSGIRVFVPTKLGVTTGRYVIEATNGSTVRKIAYEFYNSIFSSVPRLTSHCDSGNQHLVGTGFTSPKDVEVVFIEEMQRTGTYEGTISVHERFRWTIRSGEQGEFVATVDLNLPEGYFVVADQDGNWEDNFPDFLNFGSPWDAQLAQPVGQCSESLNAIPDASIPEPSTDHVLQGDKQHSASLAEIDEWLYSGDEGVIITIEVESDEMDVRVELHDDKGNLLIEDDDSGDRTNAQITQFTLPKTGEYYVVVRSLGDKEGSYTIQLTEDSSQSNIRSHPLEPTFVEDVLTANPISGIWAVTAIGCQEFGDRNHGFSLIEMSENGTTITLYTPENSSFDFDQPSAVAEVIAQNEYRIIEVGWLLWLEHGDIIQKTSPRQMEARGTWEGRMCNGYSFDYAGSPD